MAVQMESLMDILMDDLLAICLDRQKAFYLASLMDNLMEKQLAWFVWSVLSVSEGYSDVVSLGNMLGSADGYVLGVSDGYSDGVSVGNILGSSEVYSASLMDILME
jgi:hypothetical protein